MDTNARFTATRTRTRLAPRLWLAFGVLAVGAALSLLRPAAAQEAQAEAQLATAEELHDLVGPIALYPDDLVAIVLPASTYPLQVVQAARFLEDRERDSTLKPSDDWDDSVVALLNYPEALKLLNDDLDWTYDLGAAVLNQRADVLNAIQDFRDQAYAAGNLRSDERQTVAQEGDTIEIKPADPKVIYVPYYEPERVVVYQPAPVYYYYPRPYPVYYYPYPSHYHFGTSFFWGVNTWFSIGWHSHVFHVYDPFYYGHPYYGWTYYNPYYVRNVYVNVNHIHRYPNYVWEPQHRYGGRPVVHGTERRVYTADRTPRDGAVDSNAAATRSREGAANAARAGRANGGIGTQAQNGQPTSSQSYRNRTAASPQGAPQGQSGTPAAHANGANAERAGRANGGTRSTPPGRGTEARPPPGLAAQPRESSATAPPPRTPTYRGGGDLSQALERSAGRANPAAGRSNPGIAQANPGAERANPSADRANPGAGRANPSAGRANPGVSPRAYAGSTGMPRESSRASPPPRYQASEAPPSNGGGIGAQRSAPVSGRGNAGAVQGGGAGRSGDSGGGGANYRGGGNGGDSGGGGSYRSGGNGGGGERGSHGATRHVR